MSVSFDDHEDDYYQRRPSWREIDRRRDRSLHSRIKEKYERTDSEKAIQRSGWLKEKYLREVEKLFSGKKGSPEHEKALKRLQNAYGTKRFTRAAREYVREYGLPEEWNLLLLLLEAEDEKVVCEAMESLSRRLPERSPIERQGFLAKIRSLLLVNENPRIRACAERILAEVGA
ncbi:hypothetical protein [Thermosulfurimonas sp.]|nr:hypothetical protein [Thermosulfurimonas sp.]